MLVMVANVGFDHMLDKYGMLWTWMIVVNMYWDSCRVQAKCHGTGRLRGR